MHDWQEKFKNLLQLSDNDVSLVINGDIRTLFKENKNGAIRLLSVVGVGFLALLIYMALFSWCGGVAKVFFTVLVFSGLAFFALKVLGKDNLAKATAIRPLFYFLSFIFGFWSLSMLSDVTSLGSGWSLLLALLIIAGLGGGLFYLFPKLVEKGLTGPQVILSSLVLTSLLFSLQISFIQIQIDNEKVIARQSMEQIRLRDAEAMRKSSMSASQKVCTSEEECKRMNVKQNEYYAKFESNVNEACESAVAKEITSRFEWTVSPKSSKFDDYKVDALNDTITVTGTKAQLISDGGEKTTISYVCRYNTKTRVTQVSVRQ